MLELHLQMFFSQVLLAEINKKLLDFKTAHGRWPEGVQVDLISDSLSRYLGENNIAAAAGKKIGVALIMRGAEAKEIRVKGGRA